MVVIGYNALKLKLKKETGNKCVSRRLAMGENAGAESSRGEMKTEVVLVSSYVDVTKPKRCSLVAIKYVQVTKLS